MLITAGMLALLMLSGAGAAATEPEADERVAYAQLVVRERVIVRVPASRPPPPIRWRTKRTPRCIRADGLAGVAFMTPDSIDLITRGGERTRAEFESACPALDYYSGVYLIPSADQKLCVGRDSIHSRSGGECQIKRLRTLVPAK